MNRMIACFALLLPLASQAQSGRLTTEQLAQMCAFAVEDAKDTKEMLQGMTCINYIRGAYEAQIFFTPGGKGVYCFPDGTRAKETARTFVRWAKENRHAHLVPAGLSLVAAMGSAYPCEKP